MSLAFQRCFHHADREAVARCPACRGFFCRECVTEHDERVICAACLKKLALPSRPRHTSWAGALRVLQVAGGLLIALVFFYWLGLSLLDLPSSFHDGTLWRGRWLDETL